MPKSNAFVESVCEYLAPLGQVRARPMFGGWGIYVDGRFCAIVIRGALYFKADETSRPEFEAKGLRPFKPFPDQATVISYYDAPPTRRLRSDQGREVGLRRAARKRPTSSVTCPRAPPEVFEDPAEMLAWGRKALEAALRNRGKKPAGRRKR